MELKNDTACPLIITFLHLPMSGILVILLFDKSSSSSAGSEFRAYKQKTFYIIICFLNELCQKDNYAIAVLGHVCS